MEHGESGLDEVLARLDARHGRDAVAVGECLVALARVVSTFDASNNIIQIDTLRLQGAHEVEAVHALVYSVVRMRRAIPRLFEALAVLGNFGFGAEAVFEQAASLEVAFALHLVVLVQQYILAGLCALLSGPRSSQKMLREFTVAEAH